MRLGDRRRVSWPDQSHHVCVRLKHGAALRGGWVLSAGRTDAHRDCINAMAIVHGHQRLVVSGSRDGIVKVWK
jgi:hypothetical protein